MRRNSHDVDDRELSLFLEADEDSLEFRRTTEHVETCERCQQRLNQLSSDEDIDRETRDLLSGYPWDQLETAREMEKARDTTSDLPIDTDFLSPPSHPEMLGRLGRYEIERVIGAGGMGVVMKGFDSELNRPIAVKVLGRHLAHSGAARRRFTRESRAAAAVVHEHVVAIHNVETEGDVPFLVMQFVAGESLQTRIDRQGPLPIRELLRIGIQAAAGLAAAHEQGVVHRDVKPANILLENGVERALLTDFGLARTVDDASLTQTGVIAGTPHYMSPEQSNGQASDHRTDLFSLGSVLYFMATGHPPFRAERAMGVLNRICHDRQKPLWQIAEDVPDELSILVDRLLRKERAKRIATADLVREQLVKLLARQQQPRTGLWRRLRRVALRSPETVIVSAVLATAIFCMSMAVVTWNGLPVQINSESSFTPPDAPSTITVDVPPVFSETESTEFTQALDEVRQRLEKLNTPGVFAVSPNPVGPDDADALESLHWRLERLQNDSTNESQPHHNGEQR